MLGTVTSVDGAAHTITVKDDKTAADYVISLADTRTLLKVEPGAKDLHNAVRITADDLAASDRVDIRGFKSDAPNGINAKSVVLMSARDLAQKHQAELQAWQNSTVGTVTSVDPSTNSVKIMMKSRRKSDAGYGSNFFYDRIHALFTRQPANRSAISIGGYSARRSASCTRTKKCGRLFRLGGKGLFGARSYDCGDHNVAIGRWQANRCEEPPDEAAGDAFF